MSRFATLLARLMIATIFLTSAVGNKIPQFREVAGYMAAEEVPAPQVLLVGAIVFLILGSLAVITGFKIRCGAGLLLVFLVLATYFFHDFWNFEGQEQQMQMIQFMKNLSLMGTMLFLMNQGGGSMSLESCSNKTGRTEVPAPTVPATH
ncbi:MAG: DoxX family protein [Planctomycetota bacterium]|nr:MAG: DoxX family protein [Planctomycetota bacterium]